ncbi:hypothetical protein ACSMXM_01355 [Pacificimonas sp. ICDLI1SI03]
MAWERQVGPGGSALPQAGADAFGVNIGAEISQIGQQLRGTELRQYAVDRQREAGREAARATKDLSALRAEMDEAADIAANDGSLADSPDYLTELDKTFEDRREAIMGRVSNSNVRESLDTNFASYRDAFMSRQKIARNGAIRAGQVADIEVAIDTSAKILRQAPGDTQVFAREMEALSMALFAAPGDEATAEQLRRGAESALASSWAEGMLAAGQVEKVEALLSGETFTRHLDDASLQRLQGQLQVAANRVAVQAKSEISAAQASVREQVSMLRERVGAGIVPEDGEIESLIQATGDLDLKSEGQTLQLMRIAATVNETYETAAPLTMDADIRALSQKAGKTPAEQAMLQQMVAKRDANAAAIEKDWTIWAAKSGARIDPLDMGDPATFQRRLSAMRATQQATGVPLPGPLTGDEAELYRAEADGGASQRASLAAAFSQFGDAGGAAAMAQIAPDDLVLRGAATQDPRTSRAMMMGEELLKTAPGIMKKAEAELVYLEMMPALEGFDDHDMIRASAEALFAGTMRHGAREWDSNSEDQLKRAYEVVLGGTVEFQGRKVLRPRGMREDDFKRRIARADDAAFQAAGNGVPIDLGGNPVPARRLKAMQMVARPKTDGSGYAYRFLRGGRFVMTGPGQPYELDVAKLGAARARGRGDGG